MTVQLMRGDCLHMMKRLADGSVDLAVTSPPYDDLRTYNGYSFDFEGIAQQLYRVTRQGGAVVWNVNDATKNGTESGTSFRQALYFKDLGFNLETMIWEKPRTVCMGSERTYGQFLSTCLFSTKASRKA